MANRGHYPEVLRRPAGKNRRLGKPRNLVERRGAGWRGDRKEGLREEAGWRGRRADASHAFLRADLRKETQRLKGRSQGMGVQGSP